MVVAGRTDEANEGILHEAICLLTLSHPRIVSMVGVLLSSPNPGLVLRKCKDADLEK